MQLHEVEPWFHSCYIGRVEILDAKYNLIVLLVWPHEVEPWFHPRYRDRVETLDVKYTPLAYTNSSNRAINKYKKLPIFGEDLKAINVKNADYCGVCAFPKISRRSLVDVAYKKLEGTFIKSLQ